MVLLRTPHGDSPAHFSCAVVDIRQDFIPDYERTPGAINHNVTQGNIAETICVPGWTATVRPPTLYAKRLKTQQMRAQRMPSTSKDHEEAHLVPLCVGGHPTDHRNLWPEP